jgi:hypothetical protein
MEQELETAQAYVAAKNYESAFNILHSLGIRNEIFLSHLFYSFISFFVQVSKDVRADDEEGVRVKEQAILDLGALLGQTKKAKG